MLCDNCDIQVTQERCFETTQLVLLFACLATRSITPLKDMANGRVTMTRIGPGASMQLCILYLFSALISLKLHRKYFSTLSETKY